MQLLASLVFTLFLFAWTFCYALVFLLIAVCVPFPAGPGWRASGPWYSSGP